MTRAFFRLFLCPVPLRRRQVADPGGRTFNRFTRFFFFLRSVQFCFNYKFSYTGETLPMWCKKKKKLPLVGSWSLSPLTALLRVPLGLISKIRDNLIVNAKKFSQTNLPFWWVIPCIIKCEPSGDTSSCLSPRYNNMACWKIVKCTISDTSRNKSYRHGGNSFVGSWFKLRSKRMSSTRCFTKASALVDSTSR